MGSAALLSTDYHAPSAEANCVLEDAVRDLGRWLAAPAMLKQDAMGK